MAQSVEALADDVVAQVGHDPVALREVATELARRAGGSDLERVRQLWDLSHAEVAEMFGVSRQAVAKWSRGVPAARADAVATLAAATDVLARYLKPDRIPAVVRRRPGQDTPALLDLARDGRFAEVLAEVEAIFDLRRVQP